jgi:uncharacterized protein (DUF433 family)
MDVAPRISTDPGIHHGAHVIAGTRVPVSLVVGSLGAGMSKEEVMREYGLTAADVDAALSYAAEVVAATEVVSLAPA